MPRVQRALEGNQEKAVYLKGDKGANYSAIMDAMDALRNGRIENIALISPSVSRPQAAWALVGTATSARARPQNAPMRLGDRFWETSTSRSASSSVRQPSH